MRTRDAHPFAGRARSSGRQGAEQEVRTACRPCGRAAQGGREGGLHWPSAGLVEGRREKGTKRGGDRGFFEEKEAHAGRVFRNMDEGPVYRFEAGSGVEISEYASKENVCYVPTMHKSIFLSPSAPPQKKIPFIATHDSFRGIWDLEESLEIIWLSHFLEISFTTLTTDGRLEQCCFCYDLFSLIIRFYGALLS